MKKYHVLLLAVILFGCHRIDSGNVVDKTFEHAYSTVIILPMVTMVGKSCMTTLIPVPVYYPDSYSINLKGKDKDGKIHIETFYITKSSYDSVKMGDYECFTDGCTDRPYVKN